MRSLDMMDHLHLVVERIDLDGRPRARLLTECLENLKGRHRAIWMVTLIGCAFGGAVM